MEPVDDTPQPQEANDSPAVPTEEQQTKKQSDPEAQKDDKLTTEPNDTPQPQEPNHSPEPKEEQQSKPQPEDKKSDKLIKEANDGQTTTTNFGESEFGDRLDYGSSKYQDCCCCIFFYIHVIFMWLNGFFVSDWYNGVLAVTPSPTTSASRSNRGYYDEDDNGELTFDVGGVFGTLLCGLIAGALVTYLWLKLFEKYGESMVKFLLYLQIGCWAVVAVIGIAYDSLPLTLIGLLFAGVFSLYTWCAWDRVPFAGTCLSIASNITTVYPATVWFAWAAVFLNFIWFCIWMACASAYVMYWPEAVNPASGFLMLLSPLSFYWGINVWRNVAHTATCGVAATWYFNSEPLDNPSGAAFKRAMTTSFGSICFGSLLVPLLQFLRTFFRNISLCKGTCMCALKGIERLMRDFNTYAFAHVAIYGTNIRTSSSQTVDLFMKRGIYAIVNDNLSGVVLTCGAVLGLLVSAAVCYGVGASIYPINDPDLGTLHGTLVIVLSIGGGVLGYFVVMMVLLSVGSSVVAVFVCFAEDPAALQTNRPEQFAKLTESNEELLQMAQNGEVGDGGKSEVVTA